MPRAPATSIALGAAFVLLGTVLIVLAIPRLIAGLVAIPGDSVQFELVRGRPVGEYALRLVIENRIATLRWRDDPAYYRDIGMAAAELAFSRGLDGLPNTPLWQQSEIALRSSLRLSPVDPGAWARLAYVHYKLGAPSAQVAADLGASLRTGPYDSGLLEPRLRLAVVLWPELEAEDRRTYLEQIRILWVRDEKALARIGMHPTAYSIVIQALSPDDAAINEFRKLRTELSVELDAKCQSGC